MSAFYNYPLKIKRRNFLQAIIPLIFLIGGCDTGEVKSPFKPSDAPSNLVAKAISKSKIELTWEDNSSVEEGFVIERKAVSTAVAFSEINRVGANTTFYSDERPADLNPDTTYHYRVAYYKGNEISDYSNAAYATTLKKLILLKGRDTAQYLHEVAPVLKLLNDLVNGSNRSDNGDNILEYKDFTVVTTRTDDGAWHYSMDGTLTADFCGGKKFGIKTLHSLYRPSASACPIEGELLIASEDRSITLRFLKDQTVEVDTNSDGIVEDTVSCQVLFDSDSCL